MSSVSTSGNEPSRFTCEYCGITFDTSGEKEEHIKLEHSEHKEPSGVG
ncbi:MAG: hypothetical protein H0X03_09170 [Nitrosopumilus sp.]|nr:hypothetical protein [Nitrosopumilus sp.]